ncbi:MAG: ubiquinone/menaquinone biosynthesis methyltransferase [Chloroflexi bacterium]|nr:ubiquinone/menaquinone biosynthesis methyltransferase [Chloroflexota bacterium]
MFDRVAPRYDLLNDVMSLGQHRGWRKVATHYLGAAPGLVLDLATGTGDFAVELVDAGAHRVIGLDFSERMLRAATAKASRTRPAASLQFIQGDALALPFADQVFDGLTSAFLLRNLADLSGGLSEMHRVLRKGGRLVALDVTHPLPGVTGSLARWYLRSIVPWLGGILTDEWSAYRYLPASVDPLPAPERLVALMHEVGFEGVDFRRLGLSSVAIHWGRAV